MRRKAGFPRWLAAVLLLLCFTPFAHGETIDIMVVYDLTAQSWVDGKGGINTFAADLVARMNQALTNSNVDLTFQLVHTAVVSYTHSGDLHTDLDRLEAGTGELAIIHQWRDTYNADLVALLTDTGSTTGNVGVGNLLTKYSGDPNAAYTTSAIQSVDISQTLTHEVGHNLGCDHSKNQATSPGPNTDLNTYSAGWYFTGIDGIDYNTIMAYDDDGFGNHYTEAPIFSTPLENYRGTLAGHAEDGDNARTIRETKGVVADYRPISELTVGGSAVNGHIEWAGESDWYRFSVSTPETTDYTIQTSVGTLPDAYMRLYGPDNQGTFLSGSLSILSGQWVKMRQSLSSGIYYVEVYAKIESQTGTYTITVELSDPDRPAGITVPVSDHDGAYTVSWTPSSTSSGVTYVLEEATHAAFTSGLRVAYSGFATSAAISGRSNGVTYYYRVKATRSGYPDSDWRTAANGCAVKIAPDDLTVKQFIEAFYVAYWGRAADPGGLNYWQDLYESGTLSFAGIAENFAASGEGIGAYAYFDTVFNHPGDPITVQMRVDFVESIYQNLFDRASDAAGLAYWTGILESGATSPGAFIATIIYSAFQGRQGASADDWANLRAKFLVAEYYSDQVTANNITWTVADHLQQAIDILAGITKDSDIDARMAAVDQLFDGQ